MRARSLYGGFIIQPAFRIAPLRSRRLVLQHIGWSCHDRCHIHRFAMGKLLACIRTALHHASGAEGVPEVVRLPVLRSIWHYEKYG